MAATQYVAQHVARYVHGQNETIEVVVTCVRADLKAIS
jgi:hypothetical protein